MSEEKINQTHSDDEEEEFDWDEYLKKTNSEAASTNCFCQHLQPPVCEFREGSKLETYDPRNTTSTCIGTIIEIQGPRLRLRLDGTDDRNDFWLMCDSHLIHPFEYSAKHGRKIQPPLGYGNDLSKWPKFLEKLIQSAGENVFASESCFKTPPVKPPKNEFKIGQKLEAVDPKNPHLICPATIKDINHDKLLISFDGWSQASQFWCTYTSRDLFPVGWCKKVGHTLQHPGHLEEKSFKFLNSLNATTMLQTTPVSLSTKHKDTCLPTVKSSAKTVNKKLKQSSTINNNNSSISTNFNSNTNYNLDDSSKLSDTSSNNSNLTNDASINSPPKQQKHVSNCNKPSINKSIYQNKILKNHKNEKSDNISQIDLSIVKDEVIDPLENENKNNILTDSSQINNTFNQIKSNIVIYVNPNGDCGSYIKTEKFHTSHTKFGPGHPSNIYKSILQSFVDCAHDRFELFKLIPEGDGDEIVKLKNSNYNERKRLIHINNVTEMWLHLRDFCKIISLDDTQLLTSKSVFSNSTNKLQSNNIKSSNNYNNNIISSLPLTPQPSSSSSTSSSGSTASYENINENNNNNLQKPNGNKRPSNSFSLSTNSELKSSENEEQTSKLAKLDSILSQTSITDWSIDQVVYYISQLSENYFLPYVDIFRHHEIDGKALILLTTEILIKYMGFKLGPALKLNNYLDKLRYTVLSCNSGENGTDSNNLQQIQAKTECTY